ncbi:MAG: CPBP family intramembrane metalloprotease [Planctomycetes bacterium]|nr:CPBP family intramembrane metalloprotease [Planctomycetota bacterium]
MTDQPRTWRDEYQAPRRPHLHIVWRRFKGAIASEVFWNPQRKTSELQRWLLLGIPLLWFVNIAFVFIGHALGLRLGTDGDQVTELLGRNPLITLLAGAVFAPLIEEFLFRVLPRAIGKVIHPAAKAMWPLAFAMNVLFAAAHINPENPTFPLPQFFSGLFFWFVQTRFGFLGGFAMHACFNGSLLMFLILFQDSVR